MTSKHKHAQIPFQHNSMNCYLLLVIKCCQSFEPDINFDLIIVSTAGYMAIKLLRSKTKLDNKDQLYLDALLLHTCYKLNRFFSMPLEAVHVLWCSNGMDD